MDSSDYIRLFLLEAEQQVEELRRAVMAHGAGEPGWRAGTTILRSAHSLKAMSATLGFWHIAELAHEVEEVLQTWQRTTDGLDGSAFCVLRPRVDALARAVAAAAQTAAPAPGPASLVERLGQLVDDLAGRLDKLVALELAGLENAIDHPIREALVDPLVHLIRNCVDHGIEPPGDRVAAGKPAVGRLRILARQLPPDAVVEVSDDGRGIDPAAVADRALVLGLIDAPAAAALDLPRAIELLFQPGFSTAPLASQISGRGVGLDAVRTRIHRLGGDIRISSVAGRGSTVRIRVPVTGAAAAPGVVKKGGEETITRLDRRGLRLRAPSENPRRRSRVPHHE